MEGNISQAAPPIDIPDGGRRRIPIYLFASILLAALLLDGLDVQILGQLAPRILQDWQVDQAAFASALAAAVIGMAVGAVIGGWMGDRIGHLPILIASLTLCGIATVAAAFTASVPIMSIVRFISGVGAGAATPNALAYATQRLLPKAARAGFSALASACTPAGGMLGSGLVLLFLPRFGWKGCFVAAGCATLAIALITSFFRRLCTTQAMPRAGCVAIEISTAEPLFTHENLRINVGAAIGFFAVAFVSYAFLAWIPGLLAASGMSLDDAVRGSLAFNTMALASPIAAGRLMAWYGSKRVMLAGVVIGLVVTAAAAILVEDYRSAPGETARWPIFAAFSLVGAVTALLMSVAYAILACGYAAGCRGKGIGLGLMIARGGGFVAILAGGQLVGTSEGSGGFFLASSIALIVAAMGALIIDRHVLAPHEYAPPR